MEVLRSKEALLTGEDSPCSAAFCQRSARFDSGKWLAVAKSVRRFEETKVLVGELPSPQPTSLLFAFKSQVCPRFVQPNDQIQFRIWVDNQQTC